MNAQPAVQTLSCTCRSLQTLPQHMLHCLLLLISANMPPDLRVPKPGEVNVSTYRLAIARTCGLVITVNAALRAL
jgi:hypothetical protein